MTRMVCAALLLCAAGAAAQEPSRSLPVPLHISARDIYTRDRYLANASVEVTNNVTGTKVVTVTGPDGRVTVPVIPGSYRIAISVPGYQRIDANNFCVVAGEPARFHAVLGPDRGTAPRPLPPSDPAVVLTPRSVPSQSVMTDVEIREAMASGRVSTKLSACRLTGSRGLERWRVGHLFTPFLRVATMTQVADATNRRFTETEIPRQVLERVAWVVATPADHSEMQGDDTLRFVVAPRDVVIEPEGGSPQHAVRPPWKAYLNTQCDADVFESVLGRQFPRPGLVAAFPMDAVRPGSRIAVSYSATADRVDGPGAIKIKAQTRRVNIREEDLRTWK